MRARIYQPARTSMSSGYARTEKWVLEFPPSVARDIDPLMGWISTPETQSQVNLTFDSKEEALAYARKEGIEAVVMEPKLRKPVIRPGGYGENFSTARREPWTH